MEAEKKKKYNKKCEHDKWKKGGSSGNKNERVTWDTIFGGGNMILENVKFIYLEVWVNGNVLSKWAGEREKVKRGE